jgi:hypothetical protein
MGISCVAAESVWEMWVRLRESYLLQFSPRNQVEADLVDQMIAARWRLERLWNIETSLLDLELVKQRPQIEEEYEVIDDDLRLALAFSSLSDNSRTLALLNRYEARMQRTYRSALESLHTLREMEKLQNDPNPEIEHSPDPPESSLFLQATSDEQSSNTPHPISVPPATHLAVPTLSKGVQSSTPGMALQTLPLGLPGIVGS